MVCVTTEQPAASAGAALRVILVSASILKKKIFTKKKHLEMMFTTQHDLYWVIVKHSYIKLQHQKGFNLITFSYKI
jgi:hypothetical protein